MLNIYILLYCSIIHKSIHNLPYPGICKSIRGTHNSYIPHKPEGIPHRYQRILGNHTLDKSSSSPHTDSYYSYSYSHDTPHSYSHDNDNYDNSQDKPHAHNISHIDHYNPCRASTKNTNSSICMC